MVVGSGFICYEPSCSNSIKNDRWSKTKSGWFFLRYGGMNNEEIGYCPDHIPSWVEAWRERKRNGG